MEGDKEGEREGDTEFGSGKDGGGGIATLQGIQWRATRARETPRRSLRAREQRTRHLKEERKGAGEDTGKSGEREGGGAGAWRIGGEGRPKEGRRERRSALADGASTAGFHHS